MLYAAHRMKLIDGGRREESGTHVSQVVGLFVGSPKGSIALTSALLQSLVARRDRRRQALHRDYHRD